MADQRGQAEIKTEYPNDCLETERVNLKPKGVNGIKSLVSRKNRKGLEN